MSTNRMKDFFISYNRADRPWAEWIAWQLEQQSYTTVLQAWDFRPGSNFVLDMQHAAAQAERTIAVLSPDYLDAKFTQPEWAAAFAQDPTGERGALLPVRVRECKSDGLLTQIVYIDLVGVQEAAAKSILIAGVRRGRAKPAAEPEFPGVSQPSVTKKPRFPGTLPPIWNIPHNRNPNFTGRQELLDQLRAELTSGRTAALTQAIHGLGGVGKTQTAVEYAYRYQTDYDVVWWVRSEEAATLAADYAALAAELGLPEKDATEQNLIVRAVRRWLGQNTGWLLIFDNANDPGDIREYLPQSSSSHVIVTSRNAHWRGVASALHVEVLSREEAVDFLLKRTEQTDEKAAALMAQMLGDFPLALEQAGAYIEETRSSFSEYLNLFQSHRQRLMQRQASSTNYPATVATTWEISFQQVGDSVGEAMMNLCAFLAPDDIPLRTISAGARFLPAPLAETVVDPMTLSESLASLLRYSLVDARGELLSVHRLVQVVVGDRLTDSEKKKWARAAVMLVNDAFPLESNDVRTWPSCASLMPHALAAAEHARELWVAYEETMQLLNKSGVYLHERAELAGAKTVFEQALAICERAYGSDDPKVALRITNLGLVLQSQGDLAGAKACFERAIAIDEAAFGATHPNVAADINHLGSVLQDQDNLVEASACCERALAIDEAAYGPNHPNVAISVTNLGFILQDRGDLKGAKACFKRALAIDESVYGAEDTKVAVDLSNLGGVLKEQGDMAGALAHCERALKINQLNYGTSHPEVAADLSNIGLVLLAQGELQKALTYFEKSLAMFREFLDDNHPLTATVQSYCSDTRYQIGMLKMSQKKQGQNKLRPQTQSPTPKARSRNKRITD